jgi:hypothetical protein
MSLYNIFKQAGLELPLRVEDRDVVGSLKLFLDLFYYQLTSQASLGHETGGVHYAYSLDTPNRVLVLNNGLISAITQSGCGNSAQAYAIFLEAIQKSIVFSYIKALPDQQKKIFPGQAFYRVRPIKEGEKLFGREGLFHIPFDELYKVRNYRYSLQKEPALYLSTSVPLALRETRLDNTKYAVARFETKEAISIINVDFSYYLYHRFEEVMQDQTSVFLFLGMILPIVTACSIKVHPDHENNDFKEEYIIPQLLMRYVQERADFQGIRFYSTQIDTADPAHHRDQYNLVLPTKMIAPEGYDKNLKKLFWMTDVVSVEKGEGPTEIEQKLKQMPAYEIDF